MSLYYADKPHWVTKNNYWNRPIIFIIKLLSNQPINFIIQHNFTCTSSNMHFLYIGETGRRPSDRFAEHFHSVRNNDVDKPVSP